MPLLILIAPIVLLWLFAVRAPRPRWTVAAALVVLAVLGALVNVVFPRASAEIAVTTVFLAALIAMIAWGGAEDRRTWPVVVGGVLVGLFFCTFAAVLKPEPFYPSTEKVLPLPAGLRASVGEGGCGSGVCTRDIAVTGRPGQSAGDLTDEVNRHLVARGWTAPCRPIGWLLVRGQECAQVHAAGDQVGIELAGTRG